MTDPADLKYAEALAHEIAAVTLFPATPIYLRELGSHGVKVFTNIGEHGGAGEYLITVPAPGAHYGLFRNGIWRGGLKCTTDQTPAEVAAALLARVLDDVRELGIEN